MKPEWLVEISAWKFQTFQNLKSTLRRRGPGLTGTLSIDGEWNDNDLPEVIKAS